MFIERMTRYFISGERKKWVEMARELGIPERTFYRMYKKYREEIDQEVAKSFAMVRNQAIRALIRKLEADDPDTEVIELALKYSDVNFLEKSVPKEGDTRVLINVWNMSHAELERFVQSRLQEARKRNTGELALPDGAVGRDQP